MIYIMIFLLLLIYQTKQVKSVGEAGEYSGDPFGSTCEEIKCELQRKGRNHVQLLNSLAVLGSEIKDFSLF